VSQQQQWGSSTAAGLPAALVLPLAAVGAASAVQLLKQHPCKYTLTSAASVLCASLLPCPGSTTQTLVSHVCHAGAMPLRTRSCPRRCMPRTSGSWALLLSPWPPWVTRWVLYSWEARLPHHECVCPCQVCQVCACCSCVTVQHTVPGWTLVLHAAGWVTATPAPKTTHCEGPLSFL
jgi:phosphate/sulfate permease